MDSNGKSDPYFRMLFGKEEKARTTYKHDTLNAEYNEGMILIKNENKSNET